MAVLRLQGLNIEAGTEDIRRFFNGLPIPNGGVHIIGGKMGEAFIIFSTERARQLAMLHSGTRLKGSTVTLYDSSMAEIQHKIELKLKKRKREPVSRTTAAECCTVLPQAQRSTIQTDQVHSSVSTPQLTNIPKLSEDAIETSQVADQTPPVNNLVRVTEPTRHRMEEQQGNVREVDSCKPGYLRLYGVPKTITKEEVCWFFDGLKVEDVLTNTLQTQDQYCLVKIASLKEAKEGLKYSCNSKDFCIEVRLGHERMWEQAMEHHENAPSSTFLGQHQLSPARHLHSGAPVKSHCSPKRHRSTSPLFDTERCVMVKNLPKTINKAQIRDLFSCPDVPKNKISCLPHKKNEQTSTVFIIFTKPEEYTLAMNMNGSVVGSQPIDVSSITKEKLNDLMHRS